MTLAAYLLVGVLLCYVAIRAGVMDELDDAFTAAIKAIALVALWPVVFSVWAIGRLVLMIAERENR